MNTDGLTNSTVRRAIEALQQGDREAWAALFEPDARFYDDGSPRSLEEFSQIALGHERFTTIEEQWGNFRTYFRFQLSAAGKIRRLDIGQA